ncbi:MAG: hypothetical protein Fur009_7420 [Candidatus Microgenomates bacterium]
MSELETTPESALSLSETISLPGTASAIKRQQDAVFDCQNLQIGFLEKKDDGKDLTEDERKQPVEKLAQKLNGLKDPSGKGFFGDNGISADEISQLPIEIQKLIKDKKLAGVLVNILGEEKGGETSALTMVTFLKFIKDNPEASLDQAFTRVWEVLKVVGVKDEDLQKLSFAAVVIGKDGQASAIVTGDQQVKVFGNDDKTFDSQIEEVDDGKGGKVKKPKVQTFKTKKGDKIILCDKTKAATIDNNNIGEIIKSIVASESDPSATGADIKASEEGKPEEIPSQNAQKTLSELASGPVIVDNKDNITEAYTFEKVKKAAEPAQPGEDKKITQLRERMAKIGQLLGEAAVQEILTGILPKKDGETEDQRRLRCLLAIKERLANPGKFEKSNDPLSKYLIDNGLRSEVVTPLYLQAVEGMYYLEIDKQNQEKLRLWQEARGQGKWDIATFVSLQRGVVDTGGSIGVYENTPEGRKKREAAERDMRAAFLLTNAFASLPYETIIDPITGEKKTISFNEKLEPLLAKRREAKTKTEREKISQMIEGEYKTYLNRFMEAMRKREWQVNPFADDEIFQKSVYEQLQLLKPPFNQEKFDHLIELYKQNPSFKRLPDKTKELTEKNIRETFGKDIGALPDFLGYAQKGVEFLERRMELLRIPKPQIEQVPEIVYTKKWVEVPGEGTLISKADLIHSPTIRHEAIGSAVGRETGSGSKELPSAPAPKEKKGEPTRPENKPSSVPAFPLTQLELLPQELNLGIAVVPDRVVQEVDLAARHLMAQEKKRGNIIGRSIRNFWQGTLFSGWFKIRALRFVEKMTGVLRKNVGVDRSVPVELTEAMLDKALDEGRKLKKSQPWWKKTGYKFQDFISGTFGVWENADMTFARRWFEGEDGKKFIQQQEKESLREQTELGNRFSLPGNNKDVLSTDKGEVRYRLFDIITDKNKQEEIQSNIKSLIKAYFEKDKFIVKDKDGKNVELEIKTKEDLLKAFNLYYQIGILPQIPVDKQGDLQVVEMASNILGLVDELSVEEEVASGQRKTRYQRYQDEKRADKTLWEELQLNIYVGKASYETTVGKIELNRFERKIVEGLVKRDYRLTIKDSFGQDVLSRATELAKDSSLFVPYLGGYILGSFGGFSYAARRFFHIGGIVVTPIMAGIKEGVLIKTGKDGKFVGFRGKAISEFEQAFQEAAKGRGKAENSRQREQFEKAMVDRVSATELIAGISKLLEKVEQGELNEDDQKQLLFALAHAKARLRMTDISTQGEKTFLGIGKVSLAQNFIGYTEGHQNEEMRVLRQMIVQGSAKLATINSNLSQDISKAQAVMEAQLSFGSFKDKLSAYVANRLSIEIGNAEKIVDQYFFDLKIDNKDRLSLDKASTLVSRLVAKKALTTAGMSMVYGALMLPIMSEGSHLIHECPVEWIKDWSQVIHGHVPLTESNGQTSADLTLLQKGALFLHNFGLSHNGGFHSENINGVDIKLPQALSYDSGHNVIIDNRTGQVVDIDGVNFHDTQQVNSVLSNFGIRVEETRTTIDSTRTVFTASRNVVDQQVNIGDHSITVKVPENTHWQYDSTTGKYDLYSNDGHILIDDATINKNGIIDISNAIVVDGLKVEISVAQTTETVRLNPFDFWRDNAADYRVVHASTEPHAIQNYIESTGDNQYPFAVKFVWHDQLIHNPNTGAEENVQQAYQNGRVGMFLQIPHFGSHGEDVGIFVPAHQTVDGSWEVRFDPNDNQTIINLPNSQNNQTTTMADLAKMFLNQQKLEEVVRERGTGILASETWYDGRQVFNLANPDGDVSHQGRILAGILDPTSKDYGHSGYNGAFLVTHAVHGSGVIGHEAIETGTQDISSLQIHGSLTEITSQTVNQLQLTAKPIDINIFGDLLSDYYPLPIRRPIERSVETNETETTKPSTAQSNHLTISPNQKSLEISFSDKEWQEILKNISSKKEFLKQADDKELNNLKKSGILTDDDLSKIKNNDKKADKLREEIAIRIIAYNYALRDINDEIIENIIEQLPENEKNLFKKVRNYDQSKISKYLDLLKTKNIDFNQSEENIRQTLAKINQDIISEANITELTSDELINYIIILQKIDKSRQKELDKQETQAKIEKRADEYKNTIKLKLVQGKLEQASTQPDEIPQLSDLSDEQIKKMINNLNLDNITDEDLKKYGLNDEEIKRYKEKNGKDEELKQKLKIAIIAEKILFNRLPLFLNDKEATNIINIYNKEKEDNEKVDLQLLLACSNLISEKELTDEQRQLLSKLGENEDLKRQKAVEILTNFYDFFSEKYKDEFNNLKTLIIDFLNKKI